MSDENICKGCNYEREYGEKWPHHTCHATDEKPLPKDFDLWQSFPKGNWEERWDQEMKLGVRGKFFDYGDDDQPNETNWDAIKDFIAKEIAKSRKEGFEEGQMSPKLTLKNLKSLSEQLKAHYIAEDKSLCLKAVREIVNDCLQNGTEKDSVLDALKELEDKKD